MLHWAVEKALEDKKIPSIVLLVSVSRKWRFHISLKLVDNWDWSIPRESICVEFLLNLFPPIGPHVVSAIAHLDLVASPKNFTYWWNIGRGPKTLIYLFWFDALIEQRIDQTFPLSSPLLIYLTLKDIIYSYLVNL